MKKYEIILVREDPVLLIENQSVFPYIGLASLEAFLTLHGIFCKTIRVSEIDQYCDQADIFGISVMDHNFKVAQNVTRRLAGKTIIWGGWTATALPEYILNENANVDYVIMQDGEQRLLNLLNSFKQPELFDQIDGIAFRNESCDIVIRPPQTFVNLNDLPIPTKLAVMAGQIVYVEISRGCYGGCRYCQDVQKMRFKSAERVVDEIIHWYAQGYRIFFLGNANSLANGTLLKEIVKKIEALKIQIHIHLSGRPNDILRYQDVLEIIFRSSMIKIDALEVGIEANTQSILDLLGRKTTPEVNRQAITALLDLRSKYSPDTQIHAYIILFAHWDMTLTDFLESIRFIGDYQCTRNALSLFLQGLAGSPLWHDMKAKGFPMNADRGFQIVDYPFTDKTINRLFSKLVKIPILRLLQKKNTSGFDMAEFSNKCLDKLLEFYHAPDIEESVLKFLDSRIDKYE